MDGGAHTHTRTRTHAHTQMGGLISFLRTEASSLRTEGATAGRSATAAAAAAAKAAAAATAASKVNAPFMCCRMEMVVPLFATAAAAAAAVAKAAAAAIAASEMSAQVQFVLDWNVGASACQSGFNQEWGVCCCWDPAPAATAATAAFKSGGQKGHGMPEFVVQKSTIFPAAAVTAASKVGHCSVEFEALMCSCHGGNKAEALMQSMKHWCDIVAAA
eukprot:1161772-Pelagomonas_calceolata.AAC.8